MSEQLHFLQRLDSYGTLTLSNESPEDRAARIEKAKLDNELARWKDRSRFQVTTAFVGLIFVMATAALFLGTPPQSQWGATVLSSLLSGLVGYFVGSKKEGL